MQAVVLSERASAGKVAQVVRVVEDWADEAPPGAGQVRLRTLCSALNHMDIWVGLGIPGVDLTYPRVSGCDVCAQVEAVGEGVDAAWVGKRVVMNAAVAQPERFLPAGSDANVSQHQPGAPEYELIGEHHHGAHRECFNAPVANLQPVADDADPVQVAAFGLVALTAWGMLRKAGVRAGQSVLITGIGGGVATSALALCKHLGCCIAVTSRHQWKLDKALELGASHAVLDEGQDWSKGIRGWTGKRGVDVVVDSVGRAVHMACVKSLARGGSFVTCGCTSGPVAETDLARIFWNQLRLLGSTMGDAAEFADVCALFNSGAIAPAVDKVYPWREASAAWARLEEAEQFGKIVLDWR